jgi:hypothetical protein
MLYYNKPEGGYGNLSARQVEELEEVFSCGHCWALALTLHRLFGYPISAVIDNMIVEHAWVTLPSGKELDIMGVNDTCWSKATHENMTEEQFISVTLCGSCHTHEGAKLTLCDKDFERCRQVVNEYLIPTYNFN